MDLNLGSDFVAVLMELEPKRVFEFFEEICEIPHGSRNTKRISDWLVSFAKRKNLWYYQDEFNNVVIKKKATAGYETAEPVILQGHIDMVCEKAPECFLDMEKDGLILKTDGEAVWAEGTTLGGDNGIAVAMMLAILEREDVSHPEIEAVFTSDEEIGLIGANALDGEILSGKRMINIDSEDEGIFTVSCAGGIRSGCSLPVKREEFKGEVYSVIIGGLLGGHSGVEIDKGRANSNILLGRVLEAVSRKTDMRIISVSGGKKDNAIPRQSEAILAVCDRASLESVCREMEIIFRNEYALTDGDIYIKVNPFEYSLPMDKESSKKVITMLCCLPNGVMEMSAGIKGLVQTSLNLGVLKTTTDLVCADFGVRSSIDSQKEMLIRRIDCLMKSLGGYAETSENYSGWEYRKDSPLRELMVKVFSEQYGYEPKIQAIHAGLECGTFAGKIKDFDGISIGPDMKDIHTFSEKLYVKSTERVYKMILETLKRMK